MCIYPVFVVLLVFTWNMSKLKGVEGRCFFFKYFVGNWFLRRVSLKIINQFYCNVINDLKLALTYYPEIQINMKF